MRKRAACTSAMSEETVIQLEARVPALSGAAFDGARDRVLASGQSVLQSEEGVLYELFPDGRKVSLRNIEPPHRVMSGQRFTIR